MKREPLEIRVLFDGEQIGTLTPTEFRDAVSGSGFGSRLFLDELVRQFNASKAARGEPERVEVALRKPDRKSTGTWEIKR